MQQALMELGGLSSSAGGRILLRKFLGSKEHKEHLDWLEIDLSAAEIGLSKTIYAPKVNMNRSTYI